MNIEVTSADYRVGNSSVNHPVKVNGVYKVGDVTLKRGLIGALDLYQLIDGIRTGNHTVQNVMVQLQDEAHNGPVFTFTLVNARPIRYTAPTLQRQGRHRGGHRGAGPVLRGPDGRVMLTYQGRLPGVACIATLPAEPQPIRLDVPAFVGFAQRGPLNQPTAVEDINQYQAVFGGDLVLAQSDGVPVYASLPGHGEVVLR